MRNSMHFCALSFIYIHVYSMQIFACTRGVKQMQLISYTNNLCYGMMKRVQSFYLLMTLCALGILVICSMFNESVKGNSRTWYLTIRPRTSFRNSFMQYACIETNERTNKPQTSKHSYLLNTYNKVVLTIKVKHVLLLNVSYL